MSSQYGERWPTNGWDRFSCLGHPSKFQRFRVLPSLLPGRRSPQANQTARRLAISCAVGTLYMHFGGLALLENFASCKVHFSSISCVLVYWQRYCTALEQRASAKLCGVVEGMELLNFRRGRHLYSARRPSRWASAHILVNICFRTQIPSECFINVIRLICQIYEEKLAISEQFALTI